MSYCTNCGNTIEENVSFCPDCGKSTKFKDGFAKKVETEAEKFMENKDPFIAAILSFIFPGLGQLYNGDFKKGLLLQTAYLISLALGGIFYSFFLIFLIAIVVLIFAVYDAYTEAEKVKSGKEPLVNATLKEIVIFLLWPFVLFVAFALLLTLIAIVLFCVSLAVTAIESIPNLPTIF